MNKIVLATAASVLALAAAPAFAQSGFGGPVGLYGNLGYSHLNPNGADLNTLGGRVGARWGYLGIEGEAAFGVGSDDISTTTSAGPVPGSVSLAHSFAGYAVGFLPITPRFDILARIGYGNTHFNEKFPGVKDTISKDSVNYGAGAQYFFTGHDGIRAEYTRNDYRDNFGHADVWGVSYVRKF
jgi:hypothetical protein